MKKITKILSVALVAMMVLSLSAVALADTPSVYIPKRLAKLVEADLGDYRYPTLKVKMSSKVALGDPCPYVAGEEADYLLYFSEKPDWAGANVSVLDGGWINIDVDETGFGMIEGPLHRQPGTWISQVMYCEKDEEGNKIAYYDWPAWMFNAQGEWDVDIGDYPYVASKDYGPYTSTVNYQRNGAAYAVTVTLKDSEDFFRTNQEGGVMSITFEKVTTETICGRYDRKDTFWYVSNVSATYPAGNYITAISTDWRNDSKQNLASYKISYAVSDNETYKITYAPNTVTIEQTGPSYAREYLNLAEEYGVCANNYPSTKWGKDENGNGVYWTHYNADEAIYGEYYRNDKLTAVSGSGNKLNKWFAPGHGKAVKTPKKGTTSFKSPRVY
jgi:hypothetical protein